MTTRKLLVAMLVVTTSIHFGTTKLEAQNFGTTTWTSSRSYPTMPWQSQPRPNGWDGYQTTSYRMERDPRYVQTVSQFDRAAYHVPFDPAAYAYDTRPMVPISDSRSLPNDSYGPQWQPTYHATGYGQPGYATQPNCQAAPLPTAGGSYPYPYPYPPTYPYPSQLPKGYHKGDGLFGKDTVYADGQPIRNLFRFLAP